MKGFLLGGMATLVLLLIGCESKVQDYPKEHTGGTSSTANETIGDSVLSEEVEPDEDYEVLDSPDFGDGLEYDQEGNRYYPEDHIEEAHEVVEEDAYELVEEVYEVDPLTLAPLRVWGRDLSNSMSTNPNQTLAKYGNRRLIINGQVQMVFEDGVTLGSTFVGINPNGISKNDVITVYCYGVDRASTNGYALSAIGRDCSY